MFMKGDEFDVEGSDGNTWSLLPSVDDESGNMCGDLIWPLILLDGDMIRVSLLSPLILVTDYVFV